MSVATARNLGVRVVAALAVGACALLSASRGMAQGVTTGAVRGRALDQAGQPVAGASVQLVNSQSGLRYSTVSGSSGGYYIANVIVGSYAIEARAIGYRPARNANVDVRLGVVADIELRLEASTVELAAINVAGEAENSQLSRGRTGVTSTVSGDLLENLPSLNRSFLGSAASSPLINGNSVAGQADRFNALQIDGGANGDLFGLNASNGIPGGRNASRPISVEAVSEYQVLIAPYDVRQGGFTGGLVNAVTRSGTNNFHGSVFGFYQSDNLQGKDTLGVAATAFDRKFYGFTVGGPIIRDRLHFFVAGEWRTDDQAFNNAASGVVRNINPGDTVGSPTCRGTSCWNTAAAISATTAERVRQFAVNTLGMDPGAWGQPIIPNPDRSLFFKLTGQIGASSQAELSYTNVHSSLAVLVHDPFGPNPTRLREGYQYEQSGYNNTNNNHSVRARLNSRISNAFTNEAIASFYKTDDVREMPNPVSLMIVGADSAGAHLALGGERFSQANTLAQNIMELADNLTMTAGQHVFTLGGRVERFKFKNVFFPASIGAWYFPDTTHFFAQNPTRYERALPGSYADPVLGRTDGPIADFTFNQFGLYGQDQVNVSRALRLSVGLRVDFTSLPQPAYNPLLDTANVTVGPRAGQDMGVRTDSRPTDAVLFSPRFGFNYDVHGDQSFNLRGGAGIFSGRTPYVWASNAYTNTGLEQVQLTCQALNNGSPADTIVPAFTIDPASQPTACRTVGALTLPRPAIVYFDTKFKLPQRFSASLGMDRRLPWEMVGSVDLLYSRAINQFLLEDVNLVQGGTSVGEGSRPLYGTPSPTSSSSTPRRATPVANDVLRQFNSNQDYSYSISLNLTKNVRSSTFTVGYAYARSYDLISPTSDISNSLLNFATLDGTMSSRNLRPSFFDQPHTVRVAGTTTLPWRFRFSLIYTGNSGRPYAYRYNNDVNGDNFSGNDLFYVPLNSSDITMQNPSQYAALDNFINGEKCLRESRGRIMERNSCRNPWQSFVDARLAKSFPTMHGQNIELTMNAFNVLALMGIGGINRVTSFNENIPILSRTGYSTALGRGIYSLLLPTRNAVQYPASRWKLEFGMRYSF